MHQARSTDDIVQAHPRSSPFHLLAWKRTIEESFRYRPYYLVARDSGRICAILPLFLVRNPFLGKALISSPFAVYGGILADSAGARDALYGYVKGLGEELGVDYSELRNVCPEQCGGISNVSRYVTHSRSPRTVRARRCAAQCSRLPVPLPALSRSHTARPARPPSRPVY